MQLTVILQRADGTELAQVEVEAEKIADAGCVTYAGRYFVFNGTAGRFYTGAKFIETKPPVEIP
jgi:hypothetical protein